MKSFRKSRPFQLMICIVLAMAVSSSCSAAVTANITQQSFGRTPTGETIWLYTLTNTHGVQVKVTNYGAIITSFLVPDRQGKLDDVVLGYDSFAQYWENRGDQHIGALIGRYANRIAMGHFTLNGKIYTLPTNNGNNTLHGGNSGFDKKIWYAKAIGSHPAPHVALEYISKDGEEGFPGNLTVTVTYTLTEDNALRVDYTAVTDKDTVLNLTNHSYFNLNGAGNSTALDHLVTVNADYYTPINSSLIPTGELLPVVGTPFDFRRPTAIGAHLHDDNPYLKLENGYDQNFVIKGRPGKLSLAAQVTAPKTGRVLTVYTTEPGVQLYSAHWLDGTNIGKEGKLYPKYGGVCVEPQHFPDSPNHPQFPTTTLRRGQTYHQTTIYRFSTDSK